MNIITKTLSKIFKPNLRRPTALAERRARLERITGETAKGWGKGKEFVQNDNKVGKL